MLIPKNAIAAFGFGEPAELTSNRKILAKTMSLFKSQKSAVIFTDRDVAPMLRRHTDLVEEIDPTKVPTTYRLAVCAIQGVKDRGIKELIVVAAACHMWRCLRDLRWAARDSDVSVRLIPQPLDSYPYDAKAQTLFTRSAWLWWPAEIAYRVLSTFRPEWYKQRSA